MCPFSMILASLWFSSITWRISSLSFYKPDFLRNLEENNPTLSNHMMFVATILKQKTRLGKLKGLLNWVVF